MKRLFALLVAAGCAPTMPQPEIMVLNAHTDAIGSELWSFDGTSLTLIDDINDGFLGSVPMRSSPGGFTLFDGTLYFSAGLINDGVQGRELWRLSGNGTVALAEDINPGTGSSFPIGFTAANGSLYFAANDGTAGQELWKLDATSGDVILAMDINPGSAGSFPGGLIELNGDIFFQANDGIDGAELWMVDGGTGAVSQVADINQGAESSSPRWFAKLNDQLYFAADDGVTGEEPWKLNSARVASLVKNLNPLSNINGPLSSHPSNLTEINDNLYFNATGAVGSGLANVAWRLDGRTDQLSPAAEIAASTNFTGFRGDIYLRGMESGGGTGRELWRINSSGLVELVGDISPGSAHSDPANLFVFGGELYFTAEDSMHGRELWRLNANNLLESFDFLLGLEDSDAEVFGTVNGNLVVRAFIDRDGIGGRDARPAMLVSNGRPTSVADFALVDDGSGTFSPDPAGNSDPIVFPINQLVP